MGDSDRRGSKWEFEKKIPISMIFVLMFQTLAFTWTASATFNNVDNNAKNIKEFKQVIKEVQQNLENFRDKTYSVRDAERDFRKLSKIEDRLKVLESQMTDIRIELSRINRSK